MPGQRLHNGSANPELMKNKAFKAGVAAPDHLKEMFQIVIASDEFNDIKKVLSAGEDEVSNDKKLAGFKSLLQKVIKVYFGGELTDDIKSREDLTKKMYEIYFEGCDPNDIPSYDELINYYKYLTTIGIEEEKNTTDKKRIAEIRQKRELHFGFSSEPDLNMVKEADLIDLNKPFWLGYTIHLIGDAEIYQTAVNVELWVKETQGKDGNVLKAEHKILMNDWDRLNPLMKLISLDNSLTLVVENKGVVKDVLGGPCKYVFEKKAVCRVWQLRQLESKEDVENYLANRKLLPLDSNIKTQIENLVLAYFTLVKNNPDQMKEILEELYVIDENLSADEVYQLLVDKGLGYDENPLMIFELKSLLNAYKNIRDINRGIHQETQMERE